jgi:hypothetical protein
VQYLLMMVLATGVSTSKCGIVITQEDKKTLPDNVKVTGRHALCTDCVAAYAQHLGTAPEGDAPQHASTPRGYTRSLSYELHTSVVSDSVQNDCMSIELDLGIGRWQPECLELVTHISPVSHTLKHTMTSTTSL